MVVGCLGMWSMGGGDGGWKGVGEGEKQSHLSCLDVWMIGGFSGQCRSQIVDC